MKIAPQTKPTKWPPITFLVWAETLVGIAKQIKAVPAIEAVATTFSSPMVSTITKIASPAKRLWKM